MSFNRAAAAYRKVHMETSPFRILDALLGRLLEDMGSARVAIVQNDISAKNKAITNALAIVAELNLALDPRMSPELCERLSALYGFVEDRLFSASMKLIPECIDEAQPLVAELHAAFRQASGVEG